MGCSKSKTKDEEVGILATSVTCAKGVGSNAGTGTCDEPSCDFCTEEIASAINDLEIVEPIASTINDISITEPVKSTINDLDIAEPIKSEIIATPADPFYKLSDSEISDDYETGVEIGIVTEETVDGNGRFDIYMRAGKNQLDTQYELGRIKGADYTAAYIAMQELMMSQANQFVLGKYQADAVLAKIEAEIGEMKEKGKLERNLLKVQAWKTNLDGLLTSEQIKTEQLNHQTLATQEEETRKNGEIQRTKLEQDIQTGATQEEETRKNGEAQRTKLDQDIQTAASAEEEARKNGQAQRTKLDQDIQTAATQEEEMRRTGVVDRQTKSEQSKVAVAEKELKNTQNNELIANGLSKRALEDGQNNVTHAQCELYNSQSVGYEDKNRNDTFRTIMNGWAVAVAELDNEGVNMMPPSLIGDTDLEDTIDDAKEAAGLR